MEELAEIFSSTIKDVGVSTIKPDKCAILQEAVGHIRRIKEEGRPSHLFYIIHLCYFCFVF